MKTNRITACLLAAVLTSLTGSPLYAHAVQNNQNRLHYVPLSDGWSAKPAGNMTIPASYDLRKAGLGTSVKEQGDYGVCWSFAAMNSLESTLVAKDPDVDLSEWHLAYYAYSDVFGFSVGKDYTTEEKFRLGGNFETLSPMLCSWLGPVSEKTFPYGDFSVLDEQKTAQELQSEAQYHVTKAVEFFRQPPDGEELESCIQAAKAAIYEGHALSLSYSENDKYYNHASDAYYCPDEGLDGTYHAVSVIGWDDGYDASNFKRDPGRDGAWLIKNSWGTDSCDNGYFWLSYADKSIYEMYYLEAEPAQKHSDNYGHDDFGCGVALSVELEDTHAKVANVFEAQQDSYVTDVMFFSTMPQVEYEVQVFSNLRYKDKPDSGLPSAVTKGSVTNPGYHTITLDQPMKITEGQAFSVVLTLDGEPGQYIACEATQQIKHVYRNGTEKIVQSYPVTKEMILQDFNAGESFYSPDGENWADLFHERVDDTVVDGVDDDGKAVEIVQETLFGNLCLKALTQDAGIVEFSDYNTALPLGEKITLQTVTGEPIYYRINGGAYMPYTAPIVFDRAMTISAYVEGYDAVFEQEFDVREARLSVLGFEKGYDAGELQFRKTGLHTYEATLNGTAPQSIALMPVTTGDVLCDGMALPTGEMTAISLSSEQKQLVLSVSQDGMKTTRYIVHFGASDGFLAGDCDFNGAVDAKDAAEILVYAALVGAGEDAAQPTAKWQQCADFNCDGGINAVDASEILVYAAESAVN